MNKKLHRVMATVLTIALLSPVIVQAGAASHPLSEDAALSLLLRTLKHDRVYARRISLDCVTFVTQEETHAYFQLSCEKITPLRAAAIPKLVLSSTATAFIARLEKLHGWNRLKVIGSVTIQRKSGSARGNAPTHPDLG